MLELRNDNVAPSKDWLAWNCLAAIPRPN